MEWFNKLLPIGTLIFGWGLAQFGKYYADKKEDKKKLRKLLFNLLELRHLIKKGITFESSFEDFLEACKNMDFTDLGIDLRKEIENLDSPFKAQLFILLKDNALDSERIAYLESNIDTIIDELAEIYPIFAYELSGKYKIRERIKKANSYFDSLTSLAGEAPFDIKEWITPNLATRVLNDLDDSLKRISKTISKKVHSYINRELDEEEGFNVEEMEELLREYFTKVKDAENSKSGSNSFESISI